ncbi:MAG: hypothetical protein K2G30_00355 [Muribaculaceae bacterium]|nr:hypothetical protein [Muribaculaceae bacterium]MDE7141727.1 hypothetical protein [Muribaculaceae bacterium]
MTNSKTNHLADAIGEPARQFKGYTLQQMRARKAVNQVRIDLQRQKLATTLSTRREPAESPYPSVTATIENVFRYAQIALYSYKIARRAMNLYQSFRRAR